MMLLLLFSIIAPWPVLPAVARGVLQSTGGNMLYFPLIPVFKQEVTPTPMPTVLPGTQVFGLLGTLEQPQNRLYSIYLATANSGYYALAGQTPDIDNKITELAQTQGRASVKVWGIIYAAESVDESPLIVVTGILLAQIETAPTPTAFPAGVSVPVATVKFAAINLYSGPGATFLVVGNVVRGQACEVTGRNQANSWLQLTCGDGQQGWVDARLVEVNGNLADVLIVNVVAATPTPTAIPPTPTPTATPISFAGWRTELYSNSALRGSPVAVVDVPEINFNWGNSAPSQLPSDGFSIRFSRRITVSPGNYEFTAVADDGIRVWVDGSLLINAWPANPSQTTTAWYVLTGSHDIVVEYYEQTGLANVRFAYTPISVQNFWQASYYFGVVPSGNPAFRQQEPRALNNPLDYNWRSSSPQYAPLGGNVLGNDYWSARWEGTFTFEEGNYVFRANVDDGIRVWIDGLLVLNFWQDGYKEVNNRVIGVGSGQHNITVEYYERTGNASVQLWWYRDSAYVGPR